MWKFSCSGSLLVDLVMSIVCVAAVGGVSGVQVRLVSGLCGTLGLPGANSSGSPHCSVPPLSKHAPACSLLHCPGCHW